ncbi:MAG TPA: mechanosensitive ion channel family protein, partial [Gammaproteobacteria bacterium]|nr:mechanosensitive ion channel family protein [Gammaproteobacteria bacterium]
TGAPVPQLLRMTAAIVIFLIALIFIVSLVFGKSITGLVATTGVFGIVIGLSLRGIFENAAQGIALNIAQVFKPGDVISIPGKFDEMAFVKDVTMRNTYLQDFVGHVVAIPNSVISANVVRNYSRSRIFSVCFSLTIGTRGLSILDALRILKAVIASTDFVVAEPEPLVLISDVQSNQVKYDLSCWMERDKITPVQAKHILYTRIIEQLGAAGFIVGMPYIDYDEMEKRLAVLFHQFDRYTHLMPEEKEHYFQHELANRQVLAVLKQVALFTELDGQELEKLGVMIKTLYFKRGEILIQQGDEGACMYILVEGALQVYIKSEHQELIPVAKLAPGKYFGELSLLAGEPRSATVIALSDTMVYEISKEAMSQLFEEHPDLIQKISDKIAEQQLINLTKQKEYSSLEAQNQKRSFASALMKRISKFFWNK